MQAKLLRAAGQGEITRVGSTTVTKVDVRFIAATNRNLPAQVSRGIPTLDAAAKVLLDRRDLRRGEDRNREREAQQQEAQRESVA